VVHHAAHKKVHKTLAHAPVSPARKPAAFTG
jgi:hypothetical protein